MHDHCACMCAKSGYIMTYLIMAIAVLGAVRVHVLLAGQMLRQKQEQNVRVHEYIICIRTQCTSNRRYTCTCKKERLTGNSGIPGLAISAVMATISAEARQPLSSSAVTTRTLVCSASKWSLTASCPSLQDTTTGGGTPVDRQTCTMYVTTSEELPL